jgi:rod shape-determining protein MreC
MEAHTPPLFLRGPSPFVRLLFFGALSLVLMVFDARFGYVEPLREGLLWFSYPLQRVAALPASVFNTVSDFFVSQSRLQQDNSTLRRERLRDAEQLLTLEALRAENRNLRALLGAREPIASQSLVASIAYVGRDAFSRKVIIDKGSQAGILAGHPVIDTGGVIGQVTRVHPLLAEVTLIIDKDQAIPVRVMRNGLRGVAFGTGDGSTIELRYMAMNADIAVGDLLVTSGIDSVFPAGLPVATVSRIDRDAALQFARVLCTPTGDPGSNREVLIVATEVPDLAPYPAEDSTGARPARSGRRGRGR